MRYFTPRSSQVDSENRKCFKCLKYGHLARNYHQREGGNTDELIGDRIIKQLSLLGDKNLALVDTGSIISAIPVDTKLAEAQNRGVDVDTLRLVEKSQLAHVFGASKRSMEFLEAVFIETELEGGNRGLVPLQISPSKGSEIL
ncbi:zinc knuckle [Ostertagia ostertagi]